jgi:hypothetical protein
MEYVFGPPSLFPVPPMSAQLLMFPELVPQLALDFSAPPPSVIEVLAPVAPVVQAANDNPAHDALSFYLGSHRPHWLALSDRSLFVSHMTLRARKTLPVARTNWALDSGGFSEITLRGGYRDSAAQYAAKVLRYQSEIGRLDFASVQDWMCEPFVLLKTGLSIEEHQRRSVQSYLDLCELAPGVPWMPVLQGWCWGDHQDHVEMFARAGVDLTKLPRVGVGSICRRQKTIRASLILEDLARDGQRRFDGVELPREEGTQRDAEQPRIRAELG